MTSAFKTVSGGQTGVDRAALEWAVANNVAHGGWCPRGRKAEDGAIPDSFKLAETYSPTYAVRTRWNVRDSDGTVNFSATTQINGGSKLTREPAETQGKPWLHLGASLGVTESARRLRRFIEEHNIATLNVAGPRASDEPDNGSIVQAVLSRTLKPFLP
jgi:hypothetical protein